MNGICVISARGGSKGLPNKNIRVLMGKPLIAWSILQAQKVPEVERVVVSTDSEEISSIAKQFGAETPFVRPSNLASDNSGKFKVFKHAYTNCVSHYKKDFDFFLDLDCTNPLRDVSDISAAIDQYKNLRSNGVDGVFSVCNARKNPYFNLVEPNKHGSLKLSKELSNNQVLRRQDAPPVFEHVASIYVLSPQYLLNADSLLDGDLRGYDIGQEKSFDVDSELDFKIIEFLMSKKKIDI